MFLMSRCRPHDPISMIYVHIPVAGFQEIVYVSFSTNVKNLVWRIRYVMM